MAQQKMVSEQRKVLASQDGSVTVTVETQVTEKEIFEARKAIEKRLHGCYENLVTNMSEFRQHWVADREKSLIWAAYEGASAGGGEWWEDSKQILEKQTWIDLGKKVEDFSGQAYDRAAQYSAALYQSMKSNINKDFNNLDNTLGNWGWWSELADDAAHTVENKVAAVDAKVQAMQKTALATVQAAQAAIEVSRKMYLFRNEIAKVPVLIGDGDVVGIQNFVDNVLMQIDPQLAKSIKSDPEFYTVLAIIEDHDAALTYLSYFSLVIEAVPPTFYAYMAAKGAATLLIELLTLLIAMLLTAGAALAARVAAFLARLAAASARLANVTQRVKRAKAAMDAFIRIVNDFMDAATDLRSLGKKLHRARNKDKVLKGGTKSSIKHTRDPIRREHHCAFCGSAAHHTPHGRLGNLTY